MYLNRLSSIWHLVMPFFLQMGGLSFELPCTSDRQRGSMVCEWVYKVFLFSSRGHLLIVKFFVIFKTYCIPFNAESRTDFQNVYFFINILKFSQIVALLIYRGMAELYFLSRYQVVVVCFLNSFFLIIQKEFGRQQF